MRERKVVKQKTTRNCSHDMANSKLKSHKKYTFFCIHFTIAATANLINRVLKKWSHLKLATNNTGKNDDGKYKRKKEKRKNIIFGGRKRPKDLLN